MKSIVKIFAFILLVGLFSCSSNNSAQNVSSKKAELQKVDTLMMNNDTLYSRIISNIVDAVAQKRMKIQDEALNITAETQDFLQKIESKNDKEAIDAGKKLIGELDILLTKNPDAALIPLDVQFNIDEVITDIKTVREITKAAKKAIKDGYYQIARDLLDGLKSEIVITTYNIPTATYPLAIKTAVMLMEEGKPDEAKTVLQQVFGTIVVDNITLPLPVLKAQQMLMEAQKIDSVNHENVNSVLNLLKNAKYQLEMAEEMGYGKKDKDYATLYKSIIELEKSVKAKNDSGDKFKKLLKDLDNFNTRLFPF